MTQVSRSCSSALLRIALAAGLLGAAGCAAQSDEPAGAEPAAAEPSAPIEASPLATPAAFQVVWACFDPAGNRIGLPKSTLAFCQAACPAGDSCVRCVWVDNALECP